MTLFKKPRLRGTMFTPIFCKQKNETKLILELILRDEFENEPNKKNMKKKNSQKKNLKIIIYPKVNFSKSSRRINSKINSKINFVNEVIAVS